MLVTEDYSFSKFCTCRWDFKICCACITAAYLRVITFRGFWILITCMCLWCPWCTSKDDNEVAIHSCDDNLVVYYCDCDGRQKIRKTATYTNCGPLLHNPIEGHGRHSEMIKLHVCRLPFSWWKLWKACGTQISLEKAYQRRGDGAAEVVASDDTRYINEGERHYYRSFGVLYSCLLHRFRHKFPSSILPNRLQLIRDRSFLLRPVRFSITYKSYKNNSETVRGESRNRRVLDAEYVMFHYSLDLKKILRHQNSWQFEFDRRGIFWWHADSELEQSYVLPRCRWIADAEVDDLKISSTLTPNSRYVEMPISL